MQAREHLEKARQAAIAHREDRYQREMGKVFAIAPEFADAYLLLADRENSAGQYDAAIEHSLRAQRLDPGASQACLEIASAYNGLHRYNEAYGILDNLHGAAGATWQAQYEMARAELGRGNAESALRWSKLAFASAPKTWVDARLLLANALQVTHRWKEASAEMEFYLASKSPMVRRAPVELALAHTRLLAQQQDRGELAVP